MAISDSAALQTGLQFYPESILTPDGDRILANILGAGAAPVIRTERGSNLPFSKHHARPQDSKGRNLSAVACQNQRLLCESRAFARTLPDRHQEPDIAAVILATVPSTQTSAFDP